MVRTTDAIVIRAGIALATLALVGAVAIRRSRRGYEPPIARMPDDAFPSAERADVTAFYFTSRLCAACHETPGVVREADPRIPLVPLHVKERPDLVRALGVYETPTLLLVDDAGRIRYARVGNPTPQELALYVAEARA